MDLHDVLWDRIEQADAANERLRSDVSNAHSRMAGKDKEIAFLREQIEGNTGRQQTAAPLTGDDMRHEWERLVGRRDRSDPFPQLMPGLAKFVNAHFAVGDEAAFLRGQRDAGRRPAVVPLTGDDIRGEWRRLVGNNDADPFPQLTSGLAEFVNAHFDVGTERAPAQHLAEIERLHMENRALKAKSTQAVTEMGHELTPEQVRTQEKMHNDAINQNDELRAKEKEILAEVGRLRRENDEWRAKWLVAVAAAAKGWVWNYDKREWVERRTTAGTGMSASDVADDIDKLFGGALKQKLLQDVRDATATVKEHEFHLDACDATALRHESRMDALATQLADIEERMEDFKSFGEQLGVLSAKLLCEQDG